MFGQEILTILNLKIAYLEQLKNSDQEKHAYSAYRITFDSAGSWCFDNGTARNVIRFGIDNSSSSYSELQNNFLMLGKVQLLELMEALVHQKKKRLVLILVKQIQNFV